MRDSLTLAQCENLISWEVRRIGLVRGYDADDLAQEGRIVAARCLERIDSRVSRGKLYVQTSVRHALVDLKRNAHAAPRCPMSKTGRPMPVADMHELHEEIPAPIQTPEEEAATRESIGRIRRYLGTEERYRWLWQAAVEGAALGCQPQLTPAEKVRLRFYASAATIAAEGKEPDMMKSLTDQLPKELIPLKAILCDCHTDGVAPQGYDPDYLQKTMDPRTEKDPNPVFREIPMCQVCTQKWSCLTRKIDTEMAEPELIERDREVQSLIHGLITTTELNQRIAKRTDLLLSGKPVPQHLAVDDPELLNRADVEVAPEEAHGPGEEDEAEGEEEEPETEFDEDDEEDQDEESQAQEAQEQEQEEEPVSAQTVEPAVSKANGKSEKTKGTTRKRVLKATQEAIAAAVAAPKKRGRPAKAAAPAEEPPKRRGRPPKAEVKGKAKASPKAEAPKKRGRPAKAATKAAPVEVPAKKSRAAKGTQGAPATAPRKPGRPPRSPEEKAQRAKGALSCGKPVPQGKELPREVMLDRISKLRLGQPEDFQFAIGQRIVRKRPARGDEVVIILQPNGFELVNNSTIYGSLTSAAMVAEHRVCSGNDFFHLLNSKAVEIRNARGKVLLTRDQCLVDNVDSSASA
jgi:hypothetical protein